jgi:purine-nucleoside phosphorylase
MVSQVAFPVRVFAALGVRALVVTNAAGGLADHLSVGDLVVIRDHMYLPGLGECPPTVAACGTATLCHAAGTHALLGPNEEAFGERFVACNHVYSSHLAACAHKAASELGIKSHNGVYANVSGPTFETPAEGRMLKVIGADVVGMSTVPEIVVAAHCGLSVVAFSLVTNKVITAKTFASDPSADAPESRLAPSHAEVLEAVKHAESRLKGFAVSLIESMDVARLPSPAASKVDWAAKPSAPSSGKSCPAPFHSMLASVGAGAMAGAIAAALVVLWSKSRA